MTIQCQFVPELENACSVVNEAGQGISVNISVTITVGSVPGTSKLCSFTRNTEKSRIKTVSKITVVRLFILEIKHSSSEAVGVYLKEWGNCRFECNSKWTK